MSKVELSRRGFLKSTLAATGAAMAGTAAHAGDIPEVAAAALAAAQEGAKVVLVEKPAAGAVEAVISLPLTVLCRKRWVSILMPPKSSAVWWPGAKAEWMNACFGCLPESAVTAWIGPLTLPANTTPM